MKLYCKDFAPRVTSTKKVLFMTLSDYGPVSEVLEEANQWISSNAIELVNVETVVLPNIFQEEGSDDSSLRTSPDFSDRKSVV